MCRVYGVRRTAEGLSPEAIFFFVFSLIRLNNTIQITLFDTFDEAYALQFLVWIAD